MNGIIYKIERLAVYDGPGIRTVVFLKGCPLSCIWCASPESQKLNPETGFWQDNDAGKTIGQKVSVGDVVEILEKDSVFYHRSMGGITLSGGDPVFQPLFSAAILKNAVELGFHTAMETCAYADWRSFQGILEHLDLIYVDIKHMNSQEHKKLTGKPNELILENIQRIDTQLPELQMILRVPIIPGKNDSKENIERTAKFAKSLQALNRVELLPYHRYGVSTYPVVGKKYELEKMIPPTLKQVKSLKEIMRNHGIAVQIGG